MRQEQTEYRIRNQFTDKRFRGPINSVDVEQTERRFVVGCTETGFYFLYDTFSFECKELHCLPKPAILTDIAWLKTDNGIFASSSYDNVVRFYNANSPQSPYQSYQLGLLGHCISFHETEPLVAIGLDKGFIRIFDLREKAQLHTLETGYEDEVISVEWCPQIDSKIIICGDGKGRIFSFDVSNEENYRNFQKYSYSWYKYSVMDEDYSPAHDHPIVSLCFHNNGHEFVSLDSKGIARVWDSDTGLSLLKEYHLDVVKENFRKKKMTFLNNTQNNGFQQSNNLSEISFQGQDSLLIPELNGVVDVVKDEKMMGHTEEVTAIAKTADGLITVAKDGFMNIWRRKDHISFVEDQSDWSD